MAAPTTARNEDEELARIVALATTDLEAALQRSAAVCAERDSRYTLAAEDRAFWVLWCVKILGMTRPEINSDVAKITYQSYQRIRTKAPAELPVRRDVDPEEARRLAGEAITAYPAAKKASDDASTVRQYLVWYAANGYLGAPGARAGAKYRGSLRDIGTLADVAHSLVKRVKALPEAPDVSFTGAKDTLRGGALRTSSWRPPPGVTVDRTPLQCTVAVTCGFEGCSNSTSRGVPPDEEADESGVPRDVARARASIEGRGWTVARRTRAGREGRRESRCPEHITHGLRRARAAGLDELREPVDPSQFPAWAPKTIPWTAFSAAQRESHLLVKVSRGRSRGAWRVIVGGVRVGSLMPVNSPATGQLMGWRP
ncbi:MAG: hypothetical protein LBV60_08745, partial [Streptomyces sp.]|nr:hypothetical protein [Streptomyces sp.]